MVSVKCEICCMYKDPTCQICREFVNRGCGRHVLFIHLPWFVNYHTACWVCGTGFDFVSKLKEHWQEFHPNHNVSTENWGPGWYNQYIRLYEQLLLFVAGKARGLTTIKDICEDVKERQLTGTKNTKLHNMPSVQSPGLWDPFQRIHDPGTPAPPVVRGRNHGYTLKPPNSIATLLFWRVPYNYLIELNAGDRAFALKLGGLTGGGYRFNPRIPRPQPPQVRPRPCFS